LKGEGKEGVKVKVKSVEIIPKPVGPNSNANTTSNSNTKSTVSGTGQGNGAVSGSLGGSSSSAAAVLTAANTSFELTPLSGLIKQSYKDIGTLRAIRAEREKLVREGDGGEGWVGEKVDFDGMEEHLRRFEEVYRQVFFSPFPFAPYPPFTFPHYPTFSSPNECVLN